MRLLSRVDVYLPGDIVERAPGALDRLRALWQPVDLGTDRARNRIEGATFVYELRGALDALGIDDARSLVVDGVTVFHDARGALGDLPDLLLALSDHVSLFGERSQELRLSVEHEEAGLHRVLDATVPTERPRTAPAARVEVLGRAGESATDYRARVAPRVGDPTLSTTLRLQFGAFVSRLSEALERAFPGTRFEATQEVEDAEELPPADDPGAAHKPRARLAETAAPTATSR